MKSMLAKSAAMVALGVVVWGCMATGNLDVDDEEVGQIGSAICEGWDNGGRTCMAQCSDGGWYTVANAPPLKYGNCQDEAVHKCSQLKLGYLGACWSR